MMMKFIYYVVATFVLFLSIGCSNKGISPPKKADSNLSDINSSMYALSYCQSHFDIEDINDPLYGADKIVVYKKEHKMLVYRKGELVETFPVSMGKNALLGDKIAEGDYRTPIGNYRIINKKCHERLYRALSISFPNQQDIQESKKQGKSSGGGITIHGQPIWNANGNGDAYTLTQDWTEGCIAVTNVAMERLWNTIKMSTEIEIYP